MSLFIFFGFVSGFFLAPAVVASEDSADFTWLRSSLDECGKSLQRDSETVGKRLAARINRHHHLIASSLGDDEHFESGFWIQFDPNKGKSDSLKPLASFVYLAESLFDFKIVFLSDPLDSISRRLLLQEDPRIYFLNKSLFEDGPPTAEALEPELRKLQLKSGYPDVLFRSGKELAAFDEFFPISVLVPASIGAIRKTTHQLFADVKAYGEKHRDFFSEELRILTLEFRSILTQILPLRKRIAGASLFLRQLEQRVENLESGFRFKTSQDENNLTHSALISTESATEPALNIESTIRRDEEGFIDSSETDFLIENRSLTLFYHEAHYMSELLEEALEEPSAKPSKARSSYESFLLRQIISFRFLRLWLEDSLADIQYFEETVSELEAFDCVGDWPKALTQKLQKIDHRLLRFLRPRPSLPRKIPASELD